MEKQQRNECTPLLKDVSHYNPVEPTIWNKDGNVPEKTGTYIKQEIEKSYSNEYILSLSKSDRTSDEVTKENNADVEVYRTDSQPLNYRPILAHVHCDVSIGENNEDEDEMAIETEHGRLRTENIHDRDASLITGYVSNSNGLLNSESNDKKSVVPHNLLRPLGDHLDSELITLSLRHMLKVVLTTAPIITVVCLIGFCLSKLPYTKNCLEYPKSFDCKYYDKDLIFGVNRTTRLVSI